MVVDNHSSIEDHLETKSSIKGADLWMASLEPKAIGSGAQEENVPKYIGRLCFVLWR